MFKTTFRDLAATLCGTLGMLTIAVSLILTPLPAWADEPGAPSACPTFCHACQVVLIDNGNDHECAGDCG